MDENWEVNDSAHLQNIVHFLEDINAALLSMDVVSWMHPDARERPYRTTRRSGLSVEFFTSPAIRRSTA